MARFDEHGLPTFLRVHRGERLAADERLVQFRRGGLNGLRIGADSFFFQEGHAHIYEPARFGMFKVAADGEVVLVGLCDAKHQPLVPP